ncbi:MAG: 1-deoxy-D-xylulose-5-phosphate reductoisomerase, partial [Rhizobium rosettiformans]
ILNAAEETAFNAFVEDKIRFLDMAEVVETVMDAMVEGVPADTIEDVYAADREARRKAAEVIAAR